MRRRRIVVRRRDPLDERCHEFESLERQRGRHRQLISGLVQGDTVQPNDVFIVVCQLGMIVVVRSGGVRLLMSVDG
jgi:hypothetical protein